jgi:hypothetical protein
MDYMGARAYLDNAIELMEKNNDNSAILNYAIQSLPYDKLSKNAADYCIKTILHLSLLYPYLIQIIDKYVFERFHVVQGQVNDFSKLAFEQGLINKNYDAVCHAIVFALKYGFLIDMVTAQDVVDSDSCLYKLLAFLYFKKNGMKSDAALLRNHAKALKQNDEDFGRNWLFVYEVLPQSDLSGEWKTLKANGVSFLKQGFQV